MQIDFNLLPYEAKADIVNMFYRSQDVDSKTPEMYQDYMDDEFPLTVEIVSTWTDGKDFKSFLNDNLNDIMFFCHNAILKQISNNK